MADGNVVYLELAEFDNGNVMRGGALVVDPTTRPLEFRCTDALRPTALQKILWGARLDEYAAADLLGRPLLRSLKQPYAVVLVRRALFLELRAGLQVPVIQLLRDTQIEFPGAEEPKGGPAEAGASRMLANPQGRFEPVLMHTQDLHNDDVRVARPILELVFLKRDLMEPFGRIATALDVVHRQPASE